MDRSQPRVGVKAAVALAYVAMLIVNGLAGSTTLLGGRSTGEVSDAYPTLYTPAGLTFAIWGVIYLLVGLFVLRVIGVIRPAGPRVDGAALERIGRLFVVSSVLNIVWLFLWQFELFLPSLIVMIALFLTLLLIHTTLADRATGRVETLATKVPFSVYYGWITIALVANVAIWLVSIEWGRFGVAESTWTILTVVTVALIALAQFRSTRSIAYLLTVIWAVSGIVIKHLSADAGWDGRYPGIIATLVGILVVLGLAGAAHLIRVGRAGASA